MRTAEGPRPISHETGDSLPAPNDLSPATPSPPEPSPPLGLGVHAELLSRIWQQSLPLMRERVAVLQDTARLAATETLSPAARTDAADLAHKLAGSLGMFGFPRGTEIAREMEGLLDAETLLDARRLVELAADLRTTLSL